MKRRFPLLALAACLVCTGCGSEDWQAETHPAHGRVTVNGEPPAGAVIELHATGEAADVRNSRPWAIVEADGSYTLSTYEAADGAPAGNYAVTIKWPPDVSQPSLADRLNYAYVHPDRSQWNVTVTEGENELPPIEIVGARILPKDQAGSQRTMPAGPPMGR